MSQKLAVFDIDGTIAEKGVIPKSVIEGFRHIQSLGYTTTVSTGRAYQRFRIAFKDYFDELISPDAFIITEHGTKIVRKNGEIAKADYFTQQEIEHFVDFILANQDMITFASYAPPDPQGRMQVWVKNPEDLQKITAERSYADVFHFSYEELNARITATLVTHTLARLQDYIIAENLLLHFTRSNMDLILMDGYMQFVGNVADKSKALAYMEEYSDVSRENMLVAGNGINDLQMLNQNVGRRILVGNDATTPMVFAQLIGKEKVIRVNSPEDLGIYLQGLN